MLRVALVILLVVGVFASSLFGAECPATVHKSESALIGAAANLPDGYFLYTKGSYLFSEPDGIFKSEMRSFNPQVIPNTEGAAQFRISTNGEWLLFTRRYRDLHGLYKPLQGHDQNQQPFKLYMVKIDGSGLIEVPTKNGGVYHMGFVRNGPFGEELFYQDNIDSTVYGVSVALSGSTVEFGATQRQISKGIFYIPGADRYLAIAGDKLFSSIPAGTTVKAICMVIPDGGRGTATTSSDYFAYSGGGYWMCGHNMSWDGQVCVMNSSNGNGCYRRILCMPFLPKTTEPVTNFQAFAATNALASNWEPTLDGTYIYGLFHYFAFTNNSDYIVTRRHKSAEQTIHTFGVWLHNWKTNSWTMVSDASLEAAHVDGFFREGVGAQRSSAPPLTTHRSLVAIAATAQGVMVRPVHTGAFEVGVFAMSGSHVTTIHASQPRFITIPSAGVYLVRYKDLHGSAAQQVVVGAQLLH
jgi:hypothetical protein